MADIEIINLTQWDAKFVRHLVTKLCRELKLRKPVRILFQDKWTELEEETGGIVPGTERPEITWDGDAWDFSDSGFVRICLATNLTFPFVWNINTALPGQYLRQVTWFNDKTEMFVYLASHELRHLWQFEHEAKLKQICKLLDIDDECEADIFALRILSQYRQHPELFAMEEENGDGTVSLREKGAGFSPTLPSLHRLDRLRK